MYVPEFPYKGFQQTTLPKGSGIWVKRISPFKVLVELLSLQSWKEAENQAVFQIPFGTRKGPISISTIYKAPQIDWMN